MTLDSSPEQALPSQSLGLDTRYHNVIDVQFVSRALAESARCVRGARWSTDKAYPADASEIVASAYYEYNRSFEALALVEGALAHVIRQGDTVTLRLAGPDHDTLDRAERRLRAQLPEPETSSPRRVTAEFSYWSGQRGAFSVRTRALEVPTLAEIDANYAAPVRTKLADLANRFEPGVNGRLLLWHGAPGCGKTWALRALASEWRDWCTLRCVTDPQTLLHEPGYLVDLLHMRPNGRDDDVWRLIVMEDTGELLTADAKQQTGQGLSRLLNVVDGLLGESSQAIFLVTTNEALHSIRPAVARPGRCAQVLEFTALSADEGNAWLAANDASERVSASMTLAELFALRDGVDLQARSKRPVGFS